MHHEQLHPNFTISYLHSSHLRHWKRPATEGEFLKNTFLDCAESRFLDFKNKGDIIRQISKLQLSDSTVTRRVEMISDDLFSQLLKDMESSEHFSLALDESTDSTDVAQLEVWVR